MKKLILWMLLTMCPSCDGCSDINMRACREMCEPNRVVKFDNGACICDNAKVVAP